MKRASPDQRSISLALLFPVLLCVFLIAITVWINTISYEALLQQMLHGIQRPDLEDRLRMQYFTPEKFAWLKSILRLVSGLALLMFALLWIYRRSYTSLCLQVWEVIREMMQAFVRYFKPFSGKWGWLWFGLIVLAGIRSFYYASVFDLQYDEAWNANLFLRHHAWTSLFAYNNYPLHNLLLGVLVNLFGDSPLILRLPSIVFGLATMSSIMVLVYHHCRDERIALATGLLFACMPVSVFYMLYARGVMLELFFATWILGLLIDAAQHEFRLRKIVVLCLLNALATLSLLSHPAFILGSGLAFVLLAFTKQSPLKTLRVVMIYVTGSLMLSGLVLLPMMMGTGLSPAFNAAIGGQTISFIPWLNYIQDIAFFLTGFRFILWLCLGIAVILLFTMYRRAPKAWWLALLNISLCLPLIAILYSGAFPPERSFSFLILVPLSLACPGLVVLQQQTKRSWPGVLITLLLAAGFSYRAHTHTFLNWSKQLDREVKNAAMILKDAGIHVLYNDNRDFDYFLPGIDYYMHRMGRQINFYTSAGNSTRYLASPGQETRAVVVTQHDKNKYPEYQTILYSYGDVLILGKHH